jgi:hypothetical protein
MSTKSQETRLSLQAGFSPKRRDSFNSVILAQLNHAQEKLDGIRLGASTSGHQRCTLPDTGWRAFFELANKMFLSTAEYMTTQICGLVLFRRGDYCRNHLYLDAHFDG